MNILIVDDNPLNSYLLESLLKSSGYEAFSARNGKEALHLARKGRFDLIISDVLMPEMDGFCLCRECKKDDFLKQIPFIFYTATYTEPKDEIFALSLGADKYIHKPQDPEVFIGIVHQVLDEVGKNMISLHPPPAVPEEVVLKEYNATLIRKLEDKMQQTEDNERTLRNYILELEKSIEARKIAEEALKNSERQFRILTETAPVGIFRTDINGETTYVNPSWCSISRISYNDALNNGWLNAVHPDDRDLLSENWKKAVRNRSVSKTEYRFLRKDGTIAWVSGQAVPQTDPDGTLTGYIGVIYDITASKKAEEEIRKMNDDLERRVEERTAQLRAANRELEAFSYSVSHDLRSPLQLVEGYTSILFEECDSSFHERAKEDVVRIQNACRKMASIIDGLLKLSKISRAEINHQFVSLSRMAEEIISELMRGQTPHDIEWVIEPDLSAKGDPDLLRIVLTNLFSNALKFSGRKNRPVIEFRKTLNDGKTVFFVRDNGAGFDMKNADKLFTAFHRLHSPSEFDGTGIGLATVQRIILRHGGSLWAKGESGKGATVYFTIPETPD